MTAAKNQAHRKRDQICGYQREAKDGGRGVGELEEGGQKAQTSSHKINKY